MPLKMFSHPQNAYSLKTAV